MYFSDHPVTIKGWQLWHRPVFSLILLPQCIGVVIAAAIMNYWELAFWTMIPTTILIALSQFEFVKVGEKYES